MIISPALSLMYCPNCGEKLLLEPMFSKQNSTCSACGYSEPAGSAHLVTFVSKVLSQFIQNLGVSEIVIGETATKDFGGVLESHAILPAILVNAKLNTKNIGSGFNSIPLTTVIDKNGYYQRRVTTTSSEIRNPGVIIATLAETLYSAYSMSKEMSNSAQNRILDLNLLSPIGVTHTNSIQYYTSDSEGISSLNTQNAPTVESGA